MQRPKKYTTVYYIYKNIYVQFFIKIIKDIILFRVKATHPNIQTTLQIYQIIMKIQILLTSICIWILRLFYFQNEHVRKIKSLLQIITPSWEEYSWRTMKMN